MLYVGLDHRIEISFGHRIDYRFDCRNQRLNMAWRFSFCSNGLHCGVDGSATLMTEHENQASGQNVDCKLDASQSFIVEHIARDSNDKQISEAFVEDDFGRHARIGTTEYDRKRVLTLRQFCASFGGLLARHSQRHSSRIFIAVFSYVRSLILRLVRALRVSSNKAAIAFFESRNCFGGRNHWSMSRSTGSAARANWIATSKLITMKQDRGCVFFHAGDLSQTSRGRSTLKLRSERRLQRNTKPRQQSRRCRQSTKSF